ncbi:hypothetical protein [Bacillus thuringiensis]
MSPSTVNEMCKGYIKRTKIETLAKVAKHFEIKGIRELFVIIIEDETNAK